MVILGGMGDLTFRYLLPALAELEASPSDDLDLNVVAVARNDSTDEAYRRAAAERLAQHAGDVDDDIRRALVRRLHYHQADATDAAGLKQVLGGDEPLIAYLALPPPVFAPAIEALTEAGLPEGSRLVVEKPFGEDLASAVELNRLLHSCLPEDAVFRIDHFLGLQTARNLLGVRLANRVFEPLWSTAHVERVEITWDETLALEGRAGYYDEAGALKDMIQNHLLQLLCLIAMEPPRSMSARDLRDAKATVLRAVRRFDPEEAARHSRRARYGGGQVDGQAVPAYVDEEGVDPDRETETFAEVTLFIDSWRWNGVPFVLRSGKALGATRHEVVLRFRAVPHLPFDVDGELQANTLRFDIRPDRLALGVEATSAAGGALEHVELERAFPEPELSAYAHVLRDVFEGEPVLSIRDDEAEESWRIVTPVLEAWREGLVPLQEYPAGALIQG